MTLREIVHSDPDILGGTPVFIGTRVPVRILLDYLEGGESLEEFLDNYPSVSREQAVAFLEEAGRAAFCQAMPTELKDIAAEALGLPLTARAELAGQLLDSLDDPCEEENDQLWAQEAERRYSEYKAGNIEAVPAEEVFARLRARKQ
jgi:putative addiction module component (TIGR02574 family)